MQKQIRVRRRVVSCARCRKAKLACDGKAPCSRCTRASVPCVGFNAPRSIAQHLEAYIANCEADHAQCQSSVAVSGSQDLGSRPTFISPAISRFVDQVTPSFLGLSKEVPIARCVVAGTQIPSAKRTFGSTDLDENHPRSIINPQPESITLDSIPASVAQFLFSNYLVRVLTQYPIFYATDVISMFDRVYFPSADQESPSSRDMYYLSLIMAISLSCAARNKQARANSIALKLFRNALQHLPAVSTNDTHGLQALLILAQYTFLNPSVANLWLLTAMISQMLIDLGLHQEYPETQQISAIDRDLRRRIFWCAWEFEVATCAGLLRPISLLPKYIDVKFPSEIDDESISESGIDQGGRVSKFTAWRIWNFRLVEADVIGVLYQNEQIPRGLSSLDAWMQHKDDQISEWHSEVHRAASASLNPDDNVRWTEMQLYADIATSYILVTLYRPSPKIKEPTKENMMKAFAAAVRVADGYWRQSNAAFGSLKYVFHPCHHSFSSAVVFLQALQRCKAEIAESYTLEAVEGFMACFSRFFSTISERWPAATKCLEEFERLLIPIKKDYVDFLLQRVKAQSQTMPIDNIVEELFESTVNFNDVLNSWSLFDTTMTALKDPWGLDTVPRDWNAEFAFGMDPLPNSPSILD